MFKIVTPQSDEELAAYYHFRWQYLRQPWNFPPGSEKDEYEQVSEHRVVVNNNGDIVACGRVHLNTAEEAQIRHIAVHSDYQRRGLGQLILNALEAVARELGAIRAVTNSREISIDFFKACGFKIEREGERARPAQASANGQKARRFLFTGIAPRLVPGIAKHLVRNHPDYRTHGH